MSTTPPIRTPAPTRDGASPSSDVLARRLAILDSVATAISEAIDLPALLDRALGIALEVTGVDAGGIFLLDEITGDLTLTVHRGVSPRLADSFAANPGETLRAIATNPDAAVVVSTVAPGANRPLITEEGIRSYAAIPLHVRGDVIGVLSAISHTTTAFEAADVGLLVSVGRQIGMAIERARVVERERRRAQQLETISEVGRRLGTIRTERELLPEIVRSVRKHMRYEAANVLLLDEDDRTLTLAAASGLGNESLIGHRVPLGEEHSIAGWVIAHREPLLANNVRAEPRHFAAGGREQAELAVPIEAGERVLGVLDVQSAHANAFHEIDMAALHTLARQIGVAIDNARLSEATDLALRRTRAFQAVTAAMAASLDLRSTLERALDAAMAVFEADRAGVFLVEPGASAPHAAATRNLSAAYLKAVEEYYRRAPTPPSLESQRTIYIEDAQKAALAPPLTRAARREGFHSLLFLPLHHGNSLLGTFVLYHNRVRRYSDEEIALAQSFADHAGVAIEHARLYENTERSLRRTRAFQAVVAAMTASLDLPPTLERALDAAMEVFRADRASIYFYEPETSRLRSAAARNLSQEFTEAVQHHYKHTALNPRDEQSVYVEDARAAPFDPALRDAIRREGFRSALVLPLRTGGTFLGTFVLYHDQVRHYREDETDLAQTFANQVAIAIEHARLYEAERRAREQAGTILEATRTVTSSLQLSDVLTSAAGCVASALGQEACIIWLLDEEGEALTPFGNLSQGTDAADELQPITVLALPRRLRPLLDGGGPLVVTAHDQAPVEALLDGVPESRQPYAAIPLAARDRAVGIAVVPLADDDRRCEPDDMELAMAVARSAALAVENARLYEQSRRLAVSEERNRLARELHDSVTHSLFSMTLIAQALPRILDRDQDRARERIDRLNELGRGALAEMRALIFELRPAALEDEGLVAALTKHIAAFESREGITVDLQVEGERRLPYRIEEAVFRVAQEALNNVAKHARARRVTVRLTFTEEAVEMTVADNGRGFERNGLPDPAARRTLGMTSMRERAVLLGGALDVTSTPGRGTTVHLRIPLVDEQ